MKLCLFATDLHGHQDRYEKLFEVIGDNKPLAVFLGGDLLPSPWKADPGHHFVLDFLAPGFQRLRDAMGSQYPRVFLILGNDDGRADEETFLSKPFVPLWTYAHGRALDLAGFSVYGYSFVPPTPFMLKDWEKYDVGGHTPPGCVSPEEGWRSVPVAKNIIRYSTISADLEELPGADSLDRAVFLFHTPPYDTCLDRAALDGQSVDHVPLDTHVGSVAVRRFIEARQPYLTLHGHIHESVRITGEWKQQLGRTLLFGGAHDGPELALVFFDLEDPENAERRLF